MGEGQEVSKKTVSCVCCGDQIEKQKYDYQANRSWTVENFTLANCCWYATPGSLQWKYYRCIASLLTVLFVLCGLGTIIGVIFVDPGDAGGATEWAIACLWFIIALSVTLFNLNVSALRYKLCQAGTVVELISAAIVVGMFVAFGEGLYIVGTVWFIISLIGTFAKAGEVHAGINVSEEGFEENRLKFLWCGRLFYLFGLIVVVLFRTLVFFDKFNVSAEPLADFQFDNRSVVISIRDVWLVLVDVVLTRLAFVSIDGMFGMFGETSVYVAEARIVSRHKLV